MLRSIFRTAKQIEIIFLLLSLVTLISTVVLQSMTDERILHFRQLLNNCERSWVEQSKPVEPTAGKSALFQDVYADSIRSFETILPYDKTMADLFDELKAQPVQISDVKSSVAVVGIFQRIQEGLHLLELRIRFGYQTLSIIGFIFLAFSVLILITQYHKRQRYLDGLEQEKAFASRQVRVQQDEQKRIARELHDGVAQELARAKLLLQDTNAERTVEAINSIDSSIKEIRWICGSLRDPAEVVRSLEATLDETINSFIQEYSLSITKTIVSSRRTVWLPEQIFEINRILQEGLINAFRHAKASALKVHVVEVGGELRLVIEDNGQGLSGKPGLGMQGINERGKLLNGSVTWERPQSGGTRLIASFPLPVEQSKVPV